jgi:hypothetical protein
VKPAKKKPPALTELGKAIRERDADMVSTWERDYSGAIKAACAGDVTRLLNLLRAHRRPVAADELTDDDLDQLADFIEARAKHGHRQRDASVHKVALTAEMIMSLIPRRVSESRRTRAIDLANEQHKRETGKLVDAEQVRDLLRRPKGRRHS